MRNSTEMGRTTGGMTSETGPRAARPRRRRRSGALALTTLAVAAVLCPAPARAIERRSPIILPDGGLGSRGMGVYSIPGTYVVYGDARMPGGRRQPTLWFCDWVDYAVNRVPLPGIGGANGTVACYQEIDGQAYALGSAQDTFGGTHAVLWRDTNHDGNWTALPLGAPGGPQSNGLAFVGDGQGGLVIVGRVQPIIGGEWLAFAWDLNNDGVIARRSLPGRGGPGSVANYVTRDDLGAFHIVGSAQDAAGHWRAIEWTRRPDGLRVTDDFSFSAPQSSIHAASYRCASPLCGGWYVFSAQGTDGSTHALGGFFSMDPDTPDLLRSIPFSRNVRSSTLSGVNAGGLAAGWATFPSSWATFPTSWETVPDSGPSVSPDQTFGFVVNLALPDGPRRPVPVDRLLPPGSGVSVRYARGVAPDGAISGCAFTSVTRPFVDGLLHACLLLPTGVHMPDAAQVTVGEDGNGFHADDLYRADGDAARLTNSRGEGLIEMQVRTFMDYTEDDGLLEVRSAAQGGSNRALSQSVSLLDWTTHAYVTLGTQPVTGETDAQYPISGLGSRFRHPDTGEVRLRLQWRPMGTARNFGVLVDAVVTVTDNEARL